MDTPPVQTQPPRAPIPRRTVILVLLLLLSVALAGLMQIPSVRWLYARAVIKVANLTVSNIDFEQARTDLLALLGPGADLPLDQPRIVIHKSQRQAELFDGDKLVKTYECIFGQQPVGPKVKKGDSRTPEGVFRVCTRLSQSKFGVFMGISYPAREDAERGLRDGLISQQEADKIFDAHESNDCPPWDTPLGGAVGLHGFGDYRGSTAGCIAFKNRDIGQLWLATEMGTEVEIRP